MSHQAIIPEEYQQAAEQLKASPAVRSGDHLFLTGMTGGDAEGDMPTDPEQQFHNAFAKIARILAEAGTGFDAVVEMTSYHLNIQSHFETFAVVRAQYVQRPYPAWTAVEVAGLRRPGAVVEIRVVARAG